MTEACNDKLKAPHGGGFKSVLNSLSLGLRLTLMFLAVALLVWLAAGIMSWRESREQLDEFFDSYQLLLAHQLASANWDGFETKDGAKVKSPLDRLEDQGASDGRADDDALGFAVFNRRGRLIFSDGDKGRRFPFDGEGAGFVNKKLDKGRLWRLVRIQSPDGQITAVVGQKLDYRREASLELAVQVLLPWLAGLLFLTGSTIWMVRREFRPIKSMTGNLSRRAPGDLTPLPTAGLPPEVAPLGLALNAVFDRLRALLARERAFVADAAHELRTPLTALKVQAEVAQLSYDDPETLMAALGNLTAGIDRTARLVEQLLALSRLDSGAETSDPVMLDWNELIEEAVRQTGTPENMTVNFLRRDEPALKTGRPVLLSLMLRNLLDNAGRYAPEGSEISILLDGRGLSVTNRAEGLDETCLKRLGERFFRPPGQEPGGSGLGLSIVKKVAGLHGCTATFRLTPAGDFSVVIAPASK